jgi:peptidoglycan/LPS O-acetylase OafA/YrhL
MNPSSTINLVTNSRVQADGLQTAVAGTGHRDQRGSDEAPAHVNAPYRPDVDGLRAVAVLAVIGFHASSRFVPGGFVGVDVFFVISGFLISGIIFKGLNEGRFSFPTFYARRIRRIFPALIIVLLATWAVGWFALMADEYRQLGGNIAAGAGFFSNILLWRQSGYFDGAAELKPLLHLWSLGIEEQYYLLWPFALVLIWRKRLRPLTLILSVLVVSFALNLGTIGFSPQSTFYLPHTRFWELMIGSALAYVHMFKRDEFDSELIRLFFPPRWRQHLPDIKAGLGLLLILAAIVLLNKASAFPGCWALLPTLGAFLLISAAQTAWINRKFLGHPVMVFVGLISYPLYLWHWPLLSFTRIIGSGEPSATVKLAAVALAFLLAWITYQFVEKPIRHGEHLGRKGIMVPLLVSAMLVVVALGAWCVRAEGLPGRYPDEIRWLTNYKADEHILGWRAGKCFLGFNRDWRAFDSACTDAQPSDGPLLFLWGDSHAADLYPGIRQLQSSYKFRTAQYNTSLCPPVLAFDNPRQKFCKGINDWVWRKILELHPQVVVLAAQYWIIDAPDMHQKICQTVLALKQSGVRTVILIGPNPEWKEPLPRSLFKNYYRSGSFHRVPNKMLYDLDDTEFAIDQHLKSWVSETDAIYVSPISLLCDQNGCLTKVQVHGVTDLTAFDQHHLTGIASQYVARDILGPLLAQVFSSKNSPGSFPA